MFVDEKSPHIRCVPIIAAITVAAALLASPIAATAATCTAGSDCVAGTIYSPAPNPIGNPPPAVSTWTVTSPGNLIASYWAFGAPQVDIPNFPNQGAGTIETGVTAWIGFDPGASVGSQTYSGSTGGTLTLASGVTANIFALHWDSQEMVLVYNVGLNSFTISGLDQNLSGITAFSDCTDITCTRNTGGGGQGTTPLPAPLWLMGGVLGGAAGFGSWRKRKVKRG